MKFINLDFSLVTVAQEQFQHCTGKDCHKGITNIQSPFPSYTSYRQLNTARAKPIVFRGEKAFSPAKPLYSQLQLRGVSNGIYINSVLSPLAISAGVDQDFVYASPECVNTFVVKAVDRSGNTSAPGNELALFPWGLCL